MESLGYYSDETHFKSTLDTKYLQKQGELEGMIKDAYTLLVGDSGDHTPVIRDLKVLFFGLNNVWQPWMSIHHKPNNLDDSITDEDIKEAQIESQEMTLSVPNE